MILIDLFDKEVLSKLEQEIIDAELPMSFTNASKTTLNNNLSEIPESLIINQYNLKKSTQYQNIADTFNKYYTNLNKKWHEENTKILLYPTGFDGIIHKDANMDILTTITFINSDWNTSWGGEILCYSDDCKVVIGGIVPQFGKTFAFNGRQPHRAVAPIRLSSLMRMVLVGKELPE